MGIGLNYTRNETPFTDNTPLLPFTLSNPGSGSSQITILDCGTAFNAPIGSVWMIKMLTLYSGGSATNTNYVDIKVINIGSHQYKNTHFVNFAVPGGHNISDSFTVFFAKDTQLMFQASLLFSAPTGKSCKISYMELLFTRLA